MPRPDSRYRGRATWFRGLWPRRCHGDGELVRTYRSNYGLPEGVVDADDIRRHLDLERRLTSELLESTPDSRLQIFETCYTELYARLPWLANTGAEPDPERWARLIGHRSKQVYEVGAGNGALAAALAASGRTSWLLTCRANEAALGMRKTD